MKKILILIISLILTGCFNYNELNNIAIATAIGIDKDDEYKINILIENSKNNEDKKNSIAYQGKGKTIYDAFKDASLKISQEINLSHIEILIISENISKDTSKIIDFLFRYPQIKNNFLIFIAKNTTPQKIFNLKIPNESIATNIKKNIYKNNKMQGAAYPINFTDYIKILTTKGIDPIIPSITIDNNNIKLENVAIFKKNKFLKYTNTNENIGINIIKNKKNIIYVKINNTIIEINEIKTKWKMIKNKLIINVNAKGTILEVNEDINLNDKKTLDKIKNETINKINEIINSTITLSKKSNSDFLGINNYLYKNKLKKIDLKNLDYKTNINLEINSTGTLNTTIGETYED